MLAKRAAAITRPTLTVDDYLVAGAASVSNGTAVDATVFGNAIKGTHGTLSAVGTTGFTPWTVAAGILSRPSPVAVIGDTTYLAGITDQCFAFANAHNHELRVNISGGPTKAGTGVWVKMGATDLGGSGKLYDLLKLQETTSGQIIVAQLNNGNDTNGLGYAINLESSVGGPAVHSGSYKMTPGGLYHLFIYADMGLANSGEMYIHDISLNQVFSVTGRPVPSGTVSHARFGNGEAGDQVCNFFFQGFFITKNAPRPQGP